MRIRFSLIPALALAAAAIASGCNSSTESTPNDNTSGGTTVMFSQGSHFTYTEQRRDTTGGMYGADGIDSLSTDSVHSTVVDTNANVYGKTHVVAIYNQRQRGNSDTAYYWQDGSGNLYRYDYGVDVLNNLSAVTAYLGHSIEIGWVLQSKMAASSGTSWLAVRDTEMLTLPTFGQKPLYITDSATYVGDTSIVVGSSSVSTRHTRHTVKMSVDVGFGAILVSTIVADNYESTQYGEVRNTVHNFSAVLPSVVNVQISGQERRMVSHP